jgi:hypothetical protein
MWAEALNLNHYVDSKSLMHLYLSNSLKTPCLSSELFVTTNKDATKSGHNKQ